MICNIKQCSKVRVCLCVITFQTRFILIHFASGMVKKEIDDGNSHVQRVLFLFSEEKYHANQNLIVNKHTQTHPFNVNKQVNEIVNEIQCEYIAKFVQIKKFVFIPYFPGPNRCTYIGIAYIWAIFQPVVSNEIVFNILHTIYD